MKYVIQCSWHWLPLNYMKWVSVILDILLLKVSEVPKTAVGFKVGKSYTC